MLYHVFMLKAIIFDVDGVLVDSREANIAMFQALFKKAGYPAPSRKAILECFHLTLWQSLENLTGSKDQTEIKRIWNLAHDQALRRQRSLDLFKFPKKLEDTLENLHKQYKLAIVTSRIKAGIDDLFDARQMQHLFDVVVTYEDYKNPKPHPEPLRAALKKLGLSSAEAIYIGDSSSDIEAAKAAGMRSIHLATQKHPDADVGITEFHELLKVIESLK